VTSSFLIQRTRTAGPADFRFDISAEADGVPGFLTDIWMSYDHAGRVSAVKPGEVQAFNDTREPAVYASGRSLSSCAVGICETGSTPMGSLAIVSRDEGSTSTPAVLVIARGSRVTWQFRGHGYRLLRARARFRYVAAGNTSAVGVNYLGNGAEFYATSTSLRGGPRGSIAVGVAPCSTSGSGVVSRGVGRLSLSGGPATRTTTCPRERGVLADTTARRTTWDLQGFGAGDTSMRGVRLLVIDLPLR
jgi:hypothetical protein